MNDNDKDEVVRECIKRAQKIAKEMGVAIGAVIGHPSDRMTYILEGIKDGVAIVGLNAKLSPTGKPISKTFPADEIFDANVAKDQVDEILAERLSKTLPAGMKIFRC
jgi:hypothetical protein